MKKIIALSLLLLCGCSAPIPQSAQPTAAPNNAAAMEQALQKGQSDTELLGEWKYEGEMQMGMKFMEGGKLTMTSEKGDTSGFYTLNGSKLTVAMLGSSSEAYYRIVDGKLELHNSADFSGDFDVLIRK